MRSGLRCVVLLILFIKKLLFHFAYFTLFQCIKRLWKTVFEHKLSFVSIVKLLINSSNINNKYFTMHVLTRYAPINTQLCFYAVA